jgi:hypothetical protein
VRRENKLLVKFQLPQQLPTATKQAIRKLGYRVPKQERTSLRPNQRRYQSGRVLESVNHELIFRQIFAARRPRDSVYDFFVARKKWVHTDANLK